jgi:hypothetical protein
MSSGLAADFLSLLLSFLLFLVSLPSLQGEHTTRTNKVAHQEDRSSSMATNARFVVFFPAFHRHNGAAQHRQQGTHG